MESNIQTFLVTGPGNAYYLYNSDDGFIKAMYGFCEGFLVSTPESKNMIIGEEDLPSIVNILKLLVPSDEQITEVSKEDIFQAFSQYLDVDIEDIRLSDICWEMSDTTMDRINNECLNVILNKGDSVEHLKELDFIKKEVETI